LQDAKIYGNAIVRGTSIIKGKSLITENILDNVVISGKEITKNLGEKK